MSDASQPTKECKSLCNFQHAPPLVPRNSVTRRRSGQGLDDEEGLGSPQKLERIATTSSLTLSEVPPPITRMTSMPSIQPHDTPRTPVPQMEVGVVLARETTIVHRPRRATLPAKVVVGMQQTTTTTTTTTVSMTPVRGCSVSYVPPQGSTGKNLSYSPPQCAANVTNISYSPPQVGTATSISYSPGQIVGTPEPCLPSSPVRMIRPPDSARASLHAQAVGNNRFNTPATPSSPLKTDRIISSSSATRVGASVEVPPSPLRVGTSVEVPASPLRMVSAGTPASPWKTSRAAPSCPTGVESSPTKFGSTPAAASIVLPQLSATAPSAQLTAGSIATPRTPEVKRPAEQSLSFSAETRMPEASRPAFAGSPQKSFGSPKTAVQAAGGSPERPWERSVFSTSCSPRRRPMYQEPLPPYNRRSGAAEEESSQRAAGRVAEVAHVGLQVSSSLETVVDTVAQLEAESEGGDVPTVSTPRTPKMERRQSEAAMAQVLEKDAGPRDLDPRIIYPGADDHEDLPDIAEAAAMGTVTSPCADEHKHLLDALEPEAAAFQPLPYHSEVAYQAEGVPSNVELLQSALLQDEHFASDHGQPSPDCSSADNTPDMLDEMIHQTDTSKHLATRPASLEEKSISHDHRHTIPADTVNGDDILDGTVHRSETSELAAPGTHRDCVITGDDILEEATHQKDVLAASQPGSLEEKQHLDSDCRQLCPDGADNSSNVLDKVVHQSDTVELASIQPASLETTSLRSDSNCNQPCPEQGGMDKGDILDQMVHKAEAVELAALQSSSLEDRRFKSDSIQHGHGDNCDVLADMAHQTDIVQHSEIQPESLEDGCLNGDCRTDDRADILDEMVHRTDTAEPSMSLEEKRVSSECNQLRPVRDTDNGSHVLDEMMAQSSDTLEHAAIHPESLEAKCLNSDGHGSTEARGMLDKVVYETEGIERAELHMAAAEKKPSSPRELEASLEEQRTCGHPDDFVSKHQGNLHKVVYGTEESARAEPCQAGEALQVSARAPSDVAQGLEDQHVRGSPEEFVSRRQEDLHKVVYGTEGIERTELSRVRDSRAAAGRNSPPEEGIDCDHMELSKSEIRELTASEEQACDEDVACDGMADPYSTEDTDAGDFVACKAGPSGHGFKATPPVPGSWSTGDFQEVPYDRVDELQEDLQPQVTLGADRCSTELARAMAPITMFEAGQGDAEELAKHLDPTTVSWALLSVPTTSGNKLVAIHSDGQDTPPMLRGWLNARQSEPLGLFGDVDAAVTVDRPEELTNNGLHEILKDLEASDLECVEEESDESPREDPKANAVEAPLPPLQVPEKLEDALRIVGSANGDLNWALLDKKLALHGAGRGGLQEMVDNLPEAQVLFGVLRLSFDTKAKERSLRIYQGDHPMLLARCARPPRMTRFVFVHWLGPKVSAVNRGLSNAKLPAAVAAVSKHCSIALRREARDRSELSLEGLLHDLRRTSALALEADSQGARALSAEEYLAALQQEAALQKEAEEREKSSRAAKGEAAQELESDTLLEASMPLPDLPELEEVIDSIREASGEYQWALFGWQGLASGGLAAM